MTGGTEPLRSDWDRIADVLEEDTSRAYRYAKCMRYLRGSVAPTGAICDIGCGEGSGLAQLRASGYDRLTGIEVSGERLRRARVRLGGTVDLIQIAPEGALPFDDGSFDAVISAAVIEHTVAPDEHIRELARIVKPGGVVVIASDCYMYRVMQWIGVYRSVQPIDRAIFPLTLVRLFDRNRLRLVHAEGFPIPGEEYRMLRLLALTARRTLRRVRPGKKKRRPPAAAAAGRPTPDPGAWRPRHWTLALPGLLFSDENVFFLVKRGAGEC